MTLLEIFDGAHISEDAKSKLGQIDSIVFDCDGVMVDISESYDLAIKQTTRYVLEKFAGISDSIPITLDIIEGFKATGGFNDEVDLAYAGIISIAAAYNLGEDQKHFIQKVIQNSDATGIISVEKYLDNMADISSIKKKLDYPGEHGKNPLYLVFDQLFYGPKLFEKLFGKKSEFSESGLIENDVVIVNSDLLDFLRTKFQNKVAIVTGRGLESLRYSLGGLLDCFDVTSSFFLEDESRELAKPNPEPLIRSINSMKSRCCLYVGDSVEDLIMAHGASDAGKNAIFCGITGTSKNKQKKLELFGQKNAGMVLDSILLLPKVLNQV